MTERLPIMAVKEIAQALDVSPGRVHQLIRDDPTFPAEWVTLGVGKIWLAEAIEPWIAAQKAKAEERRAKTEGRKAKEKSR